MEKLDTELKGIINEKLSKVYKNNVITSYSIHYTKLYDYSSYGAIDCGPTNDRYYHEIYNNSIYIDGNFSGIVGGSLHNDRLTITNNLCYQSGTATGCFKNVDPDYFSNNISSDVITSYSIHYTKLYEVQINLLGSSGGKSDIIKRHVKQVSGGI